MSFFGFGKLKGKAKASSSTNDTVSTDVDLDNFYQVESFEPIGKIVESQSPTAWIYTLTAPNVKRDEVSVTISNNGKFLYISVSQSTSKRVCMLPDGDLRINEKQVKVVGGVIIVTIPKN